MPITILPHPDFESLVGALAGWERPREPVLQPVVIPSLPFGDHLQRRIADRFGICMGLEFLTPQGLIHRSVGPGDRSPWLKRQLVWRVLPHVDRYTSTLGVKDPSPRDRFALAGLLADRLDQYGHFRPDMIRRWAGGEESASEVGDGVRSSGRSEPAQEAWQRELWRTLQDEVPDHHPALEMARLRGDAELRKALAARYPKLLVLGTGALDPLLVEVLGILAGAGAEVVLQIVLPSMGYLGDLRRQVALPAEKSDPEEIEMPGGHPLLESMGRHAVGAFLLLGKLDDQYTHWPEPELQDLSPASSLARLQADIRSLRRPASGSAKPEDPSLRVHSCFGPRREMEVLRDELFRAFDELPGLQPGEVHIVTPDLEAYAPLVSAVLRRGEFPLPVALAEHVEGEGDPVADGLLALLQMAHGGRFEAGEVMELLQKPAVLAALETGDADAVRRWVRECGLTHGAGDSGLGSATFASNRLLAGRWFGPDSAARYADDSFVVPVAEDLPGDPALLGRFLAWFSELEITMQTWGRTAPASEWAMRIAVAARDLLGGCGESGLEMQPIIAFLAAQPCEVPLDAGAIRDWMESECSESDRRARVSGKIPFAGFKNLQNLPCRVLAMVGMQDASFPARNRIPAWDLLRTDPRVWDRNPRLDDRQLFLDALLTPSDRLIITADTRNLRTRESEPFSSCVDELLRVVAAMGGGRPVVDQRLQPFAEDYFRDREVPRSYDRFHQVVADTLAAHLPGPQPFWSAGAEGISNPCAVVSVAELARFWKDPAAAFVKGLGIPLGGEVVADESLSRSPLALDGLQNWQMKDGILQELLPRPGVASRPPLELVQARLASTRALPPGWLGEVSWNKGIAVVEPIAASLQEVLGDMVSLEYALESGLRISGRIRSSRDGGSWVIYRTGKLNKPKDFLGPWINALLAAACESPRPTLLFDEAHADAPARLEPILPDDARSALDELVRGSFDGQARPLRFAPAASHALAKALGKTPELAVEVAEATWWKRGGFGNPDGEGWSESAQLAWRDRDPFEDRAEWQHYAEAISAPLFQWGRW